MKKIVGVKLAFDNDEWVDMACANGLGLDDIHSFINEKAKPKEPLIKDEKIRKAVRAWAEANDIEAGLYDADTFSIGSDDNFISFNSGFADETKIYTIAELCGEE